jgi:hypothetical protein
LETLQTAHRRILDFFLARQLAQSGATTKVHFLDHGLSSDELTALFNDVSQSLRTNSLKSFLWTTSYLPLLVCAVEVGYGYEGNGTDFWPLLEKRLEFPFGIDERIQLSGWFDKASKQFGGVTPGESDWEQVFCHIAWPITHAVAAKDIRRPFADCLRRFRGSLDSDDSTIVLSLASISTKVGSRRFRTWLFRADVVAGILRDLLGGIKLSDRGLFSEKCRERLIEDLKREPEILQAVRSVRTRRVKEDAKSGKKLKQAAKSDLRFGEFFLRQNEHGDYALYGELPEMPRTVQTSLRAVRRRWQPRPWGFAGATVLPSDALRSARGTFSVDMSHVARASGDKPFFVAVEDLNLDPECTAWLNSVRFPASEKLAFLPITIGNETSHAIISPTPSSGDIWVLAKNNSVWPEVTRERIGETKEAELCIVAASDPILRNWLGWPAIRNDQRTSESEFRWFFPTPISIGQDGRRAFTTDDEIGIQITSDKILELKLLCDGSVLDVKTVISSALINIELPGNYEAIVLKDGNAMETFLFAIIDQKGDGFIEPDPEYPWECRLSHADAGVTSLSRSDFLNRRLVLDVEADRTIENVQLTVSLQPGGSSVELTLPRIPTRLNSTHPMWIELLNKVPPGVRNSACDITLSVSVSGITKEDWRLEPELTSIWWNGDGARFPQALTDQGEVTSIHQCLITGVQIQEIEQGTPFISIAHDNLGTEFLFDGRVGLVGDARLQIQLERPRRLLRQLHNADDNPGLLDITKRYLALASATSDSIVAEVNRVGAVQTLREWLIASLCGPTWMTALKQSEPLESVNPVSHWWKTQLKYSDLVLPKIEQTRIIPLELPGLVLREFADALPTAWWDGAVEDVSPDDAAELEPIMRPLLSDEDIYVDDIVFTETLRQANRMLCGAHLADLIIPVTGGDDLLQWTVSECSLAELSESLSDWNRKFLKKGRGRQSWSKEELHCYLSLLLYPEQLRRSSWQSVLEKLIHDRPVARAGAFVAWRVEQNARLASRIDDLMQLKPTDPDFGLQTELVGNESEPSFNESEDI